MGVYIGLDIGGTKLATAAADDNLRIVRRERAATPAVLCDGLALLHAQIERVADGQKILGIGVAIGGPLDWRTGVVSPVHQPSWRNLPLKKMLVERWECATHIDVDTNIAALGEYHFSPSPRPHSILYVTVSTGVGGGFVCGGKVYRGYDGAHPEVGHQAIPFTCRYPERVRCKCGATGGCLEALVAGSSIQRIYNKPAEDLDASEWLEVGTNFGLGLCNMTALLSPHVIVVGGGVCLGAGEKILGPARKVMEDGLKIVPVPEVKISALGADTPLIGALVVAQSGLLE